MKKYGIFLLLLFSSLISSSQFNNRQPSGSVNTLTDILGGLRATYGLINGSYSDTGQANLGAIKFYRGAQILVGDSIWVRNYTATKWNNFGRQGSGGGSGSVTSFSSGNLSPLFTTSVATSTSTPALSFSLSTQTANRVFAGPTSGGAAAPTFRALVASDIPLTFNLPLLNTAGVVGINGLTTYGTAGQVPRSTGSAWSYYNPSDSLNNYWRKTGNAGTSNITNFIGTTDNMGLMLRVNNNYAGYINSVPNNYVIPLPSLNNGLTTFGQYAGERLLDSLLAGVNAATNNTLIGYEAGRFIGADFDTTGRLPSDENVFIGHWTGKFTQYKNTRGYGRNVFIGESSGFRNTSGGENTAAGTFSLELNNAGDLNVAVGRDAMRSNIDGDQNTAIGELSLGYASTGVRSVTVTAGGTGYTTATVTFSAPKVNGPGTCLGTATGTAVISGGAIVSITLTSSGCGYSTRGGALNPGFPHIPCTITITGDGTGATADAVMISQYRQTAVGDAAGTFSFFGQLNSYFGASAGNSARNFDEYNTLIGANTAINTGIPAMTVISKATAIGYGAIVRGSNIMALGGTGTNAVNVGINTDSARKKLDIVGGDALIHELTVGRGNSSLSENTALGINAMNSATTGNGAVAIGFEALQNNLTGSNNVAVGKWSQKYNQSGTNNVSVGIFSMREMISAGVSNTAIGTNTLRNLGGVGGLYSVGISYNTAIGHNALINFIADTVFNSGNNTAVGTYSGTSLVKGSSNTFVGVYAGSSTNRGSLNIAIGNSAFGGADPSTLGTVTSTSGGNIMVGVQTGTYIQAGAFNTAIGHQAMRYANPSTGYNVVMGYQAGTSLGTGNYNVILGGNTGSTIENANNQILIADGAGNIRAKGDSIGGWRLPSYGTGTKTGIPTYSLHVDAAGYIIEVPVKDTIPLFTFGGGARLPGDTVLFTDSTLYGSFFNDKSDTLVISKMLIGLQGTSPNVTVTVYYNDSLNVSAGATKLVNAGNAATNIYTGTTVTSFDNQKIPPGVWVWCKTTTVATKPNYLSDSLSGYKSRTL